MSSQKCGKIDKSLIFIGRTFLEKSFSPKDLQSKSSPLFKKLQMKESKKNFVPEVCNFFVRPIG